MSFPDSTVSHSENEISADNTEIEKEKGIINNETTTTKENEIEMTTKMADKPTELQQNVTTMAPSMTTLPSDIINNVHSNNYFDNFSSVLQKETVTTQIPREEENTTLDVVTKAVDILTNENTTTSTKDTVGTVEHTTIPVINVTNGMNENITEANMNNTSIANERIDFVTETVEATTVQANEASTANSTALHNFNEISSSTEDLIALETTTKNKVVQEKSIQISEQPTTVQAEVTDTVKSVVHFITSEEENDVAGDDTLHNEQLSSSSTTTETSTNRSYEVKESSLDFTTTEKLFISTKPTIEAVVVEDELSVEPLTKINTVEDDQSKDVAYRSIDSSELNNIPDDNYIKEIYHIQNSTSKPEDNSVVPVVVVSSDDVKPVTEDFEIPKFIRCYFEQFQCLNGTSNKDGSYCIPSTDRCDSVFDCSDGSDEVNCEEEKCPNNHQVRKTVIPSTVFLIFDVFSVC